MASNGQGEAKNEQLRSKEHGGGERGVGRSNGLRCRREVVVARWVRTRERERERAHCHDVIVVASSSWAIVALSSRGRVRARHRA